MSEKDLKQIKSYWADKYPRVDVVLWMNDKLHRYFGKMITATDVHHIEASTVGELITQGENFLRKIIK